MTLYLLFKYLKKGYSLPADDLSAPTPEQSHDIFGTTPSRHPAAQRLGMAGPHRTGNSAGGALT